jgi:hypothetical protein
MSKASIIGACNTEFGDFIIKDKATGLRPNGDFAVVGSCLFKGLSEADAGTRALALVRTVFPVGIKIVGPNVAHPNMVGNLKIIGPDVSHPNFIYWNKDSTSFAK